MSSMFMVTVEGEDGSFLREPECFDTKGGAVLCGRQLARKHKADMVTLYACEALRTFEHDETS